MPTYDLHDLLVFSHLRWDDLYHRPQHLLSRHANRRRVFYFENPIFGMTELARLHLRETVDNVLVVVPYLPTNLPKDMVDATLTSLVDELIYEEELLDFSLMYYNPAAIKFTSHLNPRTTLWDYMEELSSLENEGELFDSADVVFISGQSLFDVKKDMHHNMHIIPSSVDYQHFSQARQKLIEPDDQIAIPRPRIGFYGAIDEKFDSKLLAEVADLRPDFHFVIAGPIKNISLDTLPKRTNIHYLGKKDYHALPLYLAGWDCSILPYNSTDSARNISCAKTPEFLAAGVPIVATPISDIVHPYGDQEIVKIADNAEDFAECIDMAMKEKTFPEWIDRVDYYLKGNSWDHSFSYMLEIENRIDKSSHPFTHPRIIQPLTINTSGAL